MITIVRLVLWLMLAVLPNGRLAMPDGSTVIDHCGAASIGHVHFVCLPDHTAAIVVETDNSYIAYTDRRIDF